MGELPQATICSDDAWGSLSHRSRAPAFTEGIGSRGVGLAGKALQLLGKSCLNISPRAFPQIEWVVGQRN